MWHRAAQCSHPRASPCAERRRGEHAPHTHGVVDDRRQDRGDRSCAIDEQPDLPGGIPRLEDSGDNIADLLRQAEGAGDKLTDDVEVVDAGLPNAFGGYDQAPEETARLRRVTALAREQLAKSGLFELVDTSTSSDENLKAHWLRKCNGCEADIARALGADMSFLGFFRKISVMEQNLEFRIRDAKTGEFLNVSQTDYRGETDESWSRAIVWLIRHGLVEPELARRAQKQGP